MVASWQVSVAGIYDESVAVTDIIFVVRKIEIISCQFGVVTEDGATASILAG